MATHTRTRERSFTAENSGDALARIPLRALAAIAARAARRVQPILALGRVPDIESVLIRDRAIECAEMLALGEPLHPRFAVESVDALPGQGFALGDDTYKRAYADNAIYYAACMAASAAHALPEAPSSADCRKKALGYARQVVQEALRASHGEVRGPIERDFIQLSELLSGQKSEEAPGVGEGIDPSEAGPLGALFPSGEPYWYSDGFETLAAVRGREGPFKASLKLAQLALRVRSEADSSPPLNTLRHRAPPVDDSEPAERVRDVIGERFVELLGTMARRAAVLEPGLASIRIIGAEGHFAPQFEQGVKELLGLSPRADCYQEFLHRLASEFRDWALTHDRHKAELGIEVSSEGLDIRTPEIHPALAPLES
jgi:hypothetical protein